jgi:sugar/nucleoside kinase (ribokinase family)
VGDGHKRIDFSKFTHLHVGALNGLMRADPVEASTVIALCRRSMNVSIGLASVVANAAEFRTMMSDDDLIFCTSGEFFSLLGVSAGESHSNDLYELLSLIAESTFKNCVVTLGIKGSITKWDGSSMFYVDATGRSSSRARIHALSDIRKFRSAIDRETPCCATESCSTVGAGDVFSAVFVAASMKGYDVEESLRAAAKAASWSVRERVWDDWLAAQIERDLIE